jgi:hypothetical protein
MRVPMVILALVATPFIADISAAQGKSASKPAKKDECLMPGLRKGHAAPGWVSKHADRACAPTTTPTEPAATTSIAGLVWDDRDWSYMPDAGEGLSGWTVQLLSNGAVVSSVSTDANGSYKFTGVGAGTYQVCVVPQANFNQIGPAFGTACPNGMGYSAPIVNPADGMWEGMDFSYYNTGA